MRNQRVRQMAQDAIFIALIILMGSIPFIGFIPIGPVSLTTVFIPVLIGAFLFAPSDGIIFGLTFGLISMTMAYVRPTSVLDPFFQNPLISVFPRLLFGIAAGFLLNWVKVHFMSSRTKLLIALPIATFLLTAFHSAATLAMLGIFNPQYWSALILLFVTSSLGEAAATAVVVTLIIQALYPILGRIVRYGKQKKLKPVLVVTEKENNIE